MLPDIKERRRPGQDAAPVSIGERASRNDASSIARAAARFDREGGAPS